MYNEKKHTKKWKTIRLIGAIVLLVFGAVFGLVSLYLNGWDFARFITNPTTLLVILVAVALGVVLLSWRDVKE